MAYFLGIDVSTTATKALLIDETGKVVGQRSEQYKFEAPRPLWAEQAPALWWVGTTRAVSGLIHEKGIRPEEILAVGLTGQMHGLVLLDKNGEVLRPSILWNDQRTETQCDEIRGLVGKTALVAETGNDALTGFTAPKILWVKENEPDIYKKVRHVLLPKDYVRYKLTGKYATDKAGAAGTLLMDVKKREWSAKVLHKLSIPLEWMPETHEGTTITGLINKTASQATGLKEGTPVVGGGGDQAAQAVGVGAVKPGVVALTAGTSGVVFATTDEPFIEPEGRLHSFCHAVPGLWHLMGVMLSAAGSLQWYRDALATEIEFSRLTEEAAHISIGSEGLFFLPYLTGERTPYPDPLARAGFIGLTVRHQRPHMTRAVLEGVAFGLRDIFELMRSAGQDEIKEVRVSGGGAKSALWRQIMADVLNVTLRSVNTTEGAAFGAAMLAGVGVGAWEDINTATMDVISFPTETLPNPASAALYESAYQVYRKLYPALKERFAEIGGLSNL